MPVQQDQNRILDAVQGAVTMDITKAVQQSGVIQEANQSGIFALPGSLAGGQAAQTDASPVANKFTLQSNAVLVFAVIGVAVIFLIGMAGRR
jgi:hypothetical protein